MYLTFKYISYYDTYCYSYYHYFPAEAEAHLRPLMFLSKNLRMNDTCAAIPRLCLPLPEPPWMTPESR